ncbi:NAD-binding protein, partial [Robiginitalea sp.]
MKNPEVVMIGLGYIGLPTAALIAKGKTRVLGVDINPQVVETVNQGKIHIAEPELDAVVADAVRDGFLRAATQASEAGAYLVVVPTPFKDKNEPDISFVEAATRSLL